MPRPKELRAKYQELQDKRNRLEGDRVQIQTAIDDFQVRLASVLRDLADVKAGMDALDTAIPDTAAADPVVIPDKV